MTWWLLSGIIIINMREMQTRVILETTVRLQIEQFGHHNIDTEGAGQSMQQWMNWLGGGGVLLHRSNGIINDDY